MMKLLKGLFFYPMLWLRGPVLTVGKFFSGASFLAAVILLFVGRERPEFWVLLGTFVSVSFAMFLLNHFYDQILLKLNPHDTDLFLGQ